MAVIKLILTMLLLMLMHGNSFAYDYDPLLLRAQTTLFPKIVLLDQDISQKIEENSLKILVLYADSDVKNAELTKKLIEDKYKKTSRNALSVNLIKYNDYNSEIATAYFLLKGSVESVNKVTSYAESNSRITFSYDYNDFESNALLSVIMKEKTYIYLNKESFQKYGIKFIPLFYKIVKVVE